MITPLHLMTQTVRAFAVGTALDAASGWTPGYATAATSGTSYACRIVEDNENVVPGSQGGYQAGKNFRVYLPASASAIKPNWRLYTGSEYLLVTGVTEPDRAGVYVRVTCEAER